MKWHKKLVSQHKSNTVKQKRNQKKIFEISRAYVFLYKERQKKCEKQRTSEKGERERATEKVRKT